MFWNYLYLWHIDEKRKNSYDGVIQVPERWGNNGAAYFAISKTDR